MSATTYARRDRTPRWGSRRTVAPAVRLALDPTAGRWATRCDPHGTTVQTSSEVEARHTPTAAFCPACRQAEAQVMGQWRLRTHQEAA